MALGDRMKDLDDRVLGSQASREAWGRRHGWLLLMLLGDALLVACVWGLVTDRPAVAGMNLGPAVALVALGLWLRVKRR